MFYAGEFFIEKNEIVGYNCLVSGKKLKIKYYMLLSVEEVSKEFGFSEQYIRKLIRTGRIAATRVGKVWAIQREVLDELRIEDLKTPVTKPMDRIGRRRYNKKKLNVLSFFSGAMGLDLGLEKVGLNILLACEVDDASRKTILTNDKEVGLIGNILDYSIEDILKYANIESVDQVDVIVGGPPCQAFSTAGKRAGFADARGNVFLKFIELISVIQPKYAVIENVRGLMSAPMTIDVDDKEANSFTFDPKKTPGSALLYVKRKLESAGYNVSFDLYNAANFGVPQARERVVIICHRDKDQVPTLIPTNSDNPSYNLPPWTTFKDAVTGLDTSNSDYVKFSERRLKYIKLLKPGQNWRDLPLEIQPEAMGNSYHLGGGKTGFYRRLDWDKPSPTLVTHPAMPATELAHPVENRPLSVQEYKRIQQFPDNWDLQGTILDKYRQVGNAVPVGLGCAIGQAILNHYKKKMVENIPGFQFSRYKNTNHVEWEQFFFSQIQAQKKKIKVEKAAKNSILTFDF